MSADTLPPNSKGGNFNILVTGAGIGGLSFAINAALRGHEVHVVDKRDGLHDFGDVFGLQPSCMHTYKRGWPGFWPRIRALSPGDWISMYKWDGTHIGDTTNTKDGLGMSIHRSDFVDLLYNYALERGVKITFQKAVESYFNSEDSGGVSFSDGIKMSADLVVAADGVGSTPCYLVTGKKDMAISSGHTVFRANYDLATGLKNPVIRQKIEGKDHGVEFYIGPTGHILVSWSEDRLAFVLSHRVRHTHPDGYRDTKETMFIMIAGFWQDQHEEMAKDDALVHMPGWDAFPIAVIESLPSETARDWKLRWRDPQPNWVSQGGRVVQLGDAAHAFLPISGYGASSAVEDGHSLAECLSHVGKDEIPLALRVHNKLRFERTACAQKVGLKTREMWKNVDWDDSNLSAGDFFKQATPWLFDHDPELYARARFEECANHFRLGTPFQNTNIPPGYRYTHWTVKELMAFVEQNGTMPVDDGEW